MQISTLRQEVTDRLLAFVWNEWAQVGVLADVHRESPWATDPEALLLFTLQVGRSDARLFDEVLDWLARNAGLVSIQRFRNHYASDRDKQIGEAAVAWLAEHVPAHLQARDAKGVGEPEGLFYGGRVPTRLDPAFLEHGFLKQIAEPSKKSQPPDLTKPVNFAFRLRRGFGVGSRSEVMRFLLTATRLSGVGSRPLFTTLAIAEAAGFVKRNVQDTLNSLAAAGWIEHVVRGNEHLYSLDPDRWRPVVWRDDLPLPAYRDWTRAFHAFGELHRWLNESDADDLSPYIRASEARKLVVQLAPSLGYAGIPSAERRSAQGADYWDAFVDWVRQILDALEVEHSLIRAIG
jgi:hypothetical protein